MLVEEERILGGILIMVVSVVVRNYACMRDVVCLVSATAYYTMIVLRSIALALFPVWYGTIAKALK